MTKSLTTILQVGVQLVFLAGAQGRCGVSEYKVYDSKNPNGPVTCKECPICPPGYGVPNQCGGRIPNGTSTDCKPCEAGKTFSNKKDTSTCQPCHECDKNIVQQECTRTQNRECGGCPPKHFLNPILSTCEECFFCCENAPDSERREGCKGLGLPRNEWCEANDENKMCKDKAPKVNKTITSGPTATVTPLTRWNRTTASAGNNIESGKNLLPAIIIWTFVSLALVGIFLGILRFLHRRYFQVNQGQLGSMHRKQEHTDVERGRTHGKTFQTSSNPSTDISAASSSESVLTGRSEVSSNAPPTTRQENPLTPLGGDLDIQRIPEDLFVTDMLWLRSTDDVDLMVFHVQEKLDVPETPQRKTWRSVGLSLGVPPNVLDRISTPEATESLLQYFKASSDEQPTMRKFVRALIRCERKDLASIICKWPYELEVNSRPRTDWGV